MNDKRSTDDSGAGKSLWKDEEREREFTRRALLQAGCALPLIYAATSSGRLEAGCYVNSHADSPHVDSHTDQHADGPGHTDSPHEDAPHVDVPHGDHHGDAHNDVGGQGSHTDSHSDTPHEDTHTDSPHVDDANHADAHLDTHDDTPHYDSHVDHTDCVPEPR